MYWRHSGLVIRRYGQLELLATRLSAVEKKPRTRRAALVVSQAGVFPQRDRPRSCSSCGIQWLAQPSTLLPGQSYRGTSWLRSARPI
jgi:hypothetical protein